VYCRGPARQGGDENIVSVNSGRHLMTTGVADRSADMFSDPVLELTPPGEISALEE